MINIKDIKDLALQLNNIEKLSTCVAKKVACIIFEEKTKTIFSTGYNHSVSCKSCGELFRKNGKDWFYNVDGDWVYDPFQNKHKIWSIKNEVHAEINALINLSYHELSTFEHNNGFCELSAIVSWSPCLDCCKSLISAGVKNIYYFNKFDNIEDIEDLCKDCGVNLIYVKIVENE